MHAAALERGTMSEPPVFLDVDTQVDFMLPTGSLYVSGAEEIVPNLARLFSYAAEQRIPIISSADAHPPDDPSFAQWPAHCVVGTPGQRRIPQTQLPSATVIPNRPGAFTSPKGWCGQAIVEKQEYDVSTNVNFDAILASLGRRRFVVFGVATEYCVLSSALALRKRDLSVDLVVDAIKAITEEGGRKATDEMLAAGVRLVKTADICIPWVQGAAEAVSLDA
jgi:nicotinamidase/pyrazinamidase